MIRFRLSLNYIYIVASMFALGTSGCSRRIPLATVVLVDPSGSVTARARQAEFAAVAALIPKMQRGDSLIVIPITDNAAAEIQGRVLRLRTPNRREAYDTDLRRFRDDSDRRFSAFSADLLAHPGQRTDILGALDVARQEFDAIPNSDRCRMIVLSDFIEDDGTYRFASRGPTDPGNAERLAHQLVKEHGFNLHGVRVYLGAVESNEFDCLGPQRLRAVQAFWRTYLAESRDRPEIHFDGTGIFAQLPD